MAGGSELGSAHISIFPQMKGFRQNVAKEAGKAVSDLKNAFSKGFDAGKQGKTLGGAFKNGFGDGSKELNSEALQSFKKDVAQASQKNTDALLKYKAAGVQVQAAQEKLNAATERYGSDSTQAQAAAIRLQQAQLRQKAASDNLKATTERLTAAKRRLSGLESTLAAQFTKTGASFRNVVGSFKDGFASIGSGMTGLVQRIPLVGSAMTAAGGAFAKAGGVIGGSLNGVRSAAGAAWSGIKSGASDAATKVGGYFAGLWSRMPAGVQSTVTAFGSGFSGIGQMAGDMAGTVGAKIGEMTSTAIGHVKGMATAAVTAVGAGIAAISGKLVEFGKEAFQSYSDYEQLSDGVAKLYGNMGMSLGEYAKQVGKSAQEVQADWQRNESAQKAVMANAQQAWKTCGMSANAYMEQATSFSAALINSLGGDTKKAADMTDVAMRAMSDNVNTFGSNAQDVQNAFNGFAKQNFTMLDNLKLGYGGTQAEMKRLIDDANAWGKANGEASDLSIDSFADIIQAIQQIQEKQQIAGTAEQEASTTIEGSISAMKAAWTNWLAELGKDDADMNAVTRNLANSIVTTAGNVLPRIGVIVKAFVASIPGMFDVLVSTLPAPFQRAVQAVKGVFSDFGSVIAPLTAALTALGAAGFGGLLAKIPLVGDLLSPLTKLLAGFASPLGIIIAMLGAIIAASPQLRAQFGDVLKDVLSSIGQALTALQPALQSLMLALGDLCNRLMPVIADALSTLLPVISPIIQTMTSALVPILTVVIQTVASLVSALMPVVDTLAPIISTIIGGIANLLTSLTPVIQGVGTVVALVVGIVCGLIKDTVQPTIQALLPFVRNIVSAIGTVIGGLVTLIRGIVNVISGIVHGDWSQVWNGFGQIVRGAISVFSGLISGIGNIVIGAFAGAGTWLWNAGRSIITGLLNGLRSAFGGVQRFVSGIGDWIVRHKGPLSYDRVMLKPAGQAIMQGFDKSLRQGWKDVQRTVNSMNAQINGGFDVDASKTGRANVGNGGGGNTFVTQTFNYPAIAPTSISTQQKLQTTAMPQW